jgi:hypothetical protein
MATAADGGDRQAQGARDGWGIEIRPRNIEDLSKLLAAVAIACYVIGLLVVNTYLYRLGVSDFSLFRTRFAITGALALIPIWASLISISAVPLLINSSRGDLHELRSLLRFFSHLVRLVAPIAVLFLLGNAVGIRDRGVVGPFGLSLGLVFVLILGLAVAYAGVALVGARENSMRADDDPDTERSRKRGPLSGRPDALQMASQIAAVIVAPLPLFLLFIWYLYNVAVYVYPQVPQQFGGGRPREARLLFREDALQEAKYLGFGVAQNRLLSSPVRMLWENEDIYVIQSPEMLGDAIIRLDKSLVSAVVVDPVSRRADTADN